MPEIPDSVSAEELLARLASAPSDQENDELPPLGADVPALPFASDAAGILDLSIFMEQIIAKAGGAPLIQVLQCLVYLASAATDRLHGSVAELEQLDDPHAMEAADEMRRSTMAMNRATRLISEVVGPATVGGVIVRCREEGINPFGRDGDRIPRRIFVSDELLDALGLDPTAFTAYLKRRAPIRD